MSAIKGSDPFTQDSHVGRREAIGAGVALALAAVPAVRVGRVLAKGDDAPRLRRLIDREQALAVAYEALAAGDLLQAEIVKAAELFASQERQHAEALIAAYEDLGERGPKPPERADVEGLGELDSQKDALEFLLGLTNESIAALNDGGVRFTNPDLVRTSAQIAGNAAQQVVVLRQQLGEDPVPDAFSTGDEE